MATPNPLESTQSTPPPSISSKTYHIAGILTTVYGLEELPKSCTGISVLWLLHPRLQTKDTMYSIGATIIAAYNASITTSSSSSGPKKGLIAVTFDQRNHGSRLVVPLANEAWRQENPTHAQDMFSIFHGTAMDTSLLIDHLGSYVLHEEGMEKRSIDEHFCLGISLGGHAAWQCWFAEERIKAAVVIIGCPDYMRESSFSFTSPSSSTFDFGLFCHV